MDMAPNFSAGVSPKVAGAQVLSTHSCRSCARRTPDQSVRVKLGSALIAAKGAQTDGSHSHKHWKHAG